MLAVTSVPAGRASGAQTEEPEPAGKAMGTNALPLASVGTPGTPDALTVKRMLVGTPGGKAAEAAAAPGAGLPLRVDAEPSRKKALLQLEEAPLVLDSTARDDTFTPGAAAMGP